MSYRVQRTKRKEKLLAPSTFVQVEREEEESDESPAAAQQRTEHHTHSRQRRRRSKQGKMTLASLSPLCAAESCGCSGPIV